MAARPGKLEEPHQRRLEATVQLLAASLGRMEALLTKPSGESLAESVEDTISAANHEALLQGLVRLRQELQEFIAEFHLQRHRWDIRQILDAELSTAWVMLENCRPRRMKGYGLEFEPATREALEQAVERLLESVRSLRKLV